jgi:hypothetical protein
MNCTKRHDDDDHNDSNADLDIKHVAAEAVVQVVTEIGVVLPAGGAHARGDQFPAISDRAVRARLAVVCACVDVMIIVRESCYSYKTLFDG